MKDKLKQKYTILTIIGARPQIIKAAALSRAVRKFNSTAEVDIKEIILHTGQHYDSNMSDNFFKELDIPLPDFNLSVGSGFHGAQTALMIKGIEDVLQKVKPDSIVLYGDTNSTLAGAIAASKMHIPVAHVEAGLRSFNKSMPEEINRIMCDHSSTYLFTPTKAGLKNLVAEGFNPNSKAPYTIDNPGVFHTGDIMYDNSLFFAQKAEAVSPVDKYAGLELKPGSFILATIHRDSNTDDKVRLNNIFRAIADIAEGTDVGVDVVIPLHPRTAKMMKINLEPELYTRVTTSARIKITAPASFFEMISLEKNARLVITDSGGVQKEAFFFRKPSLILRPQTEWVEIVECGAAILTDSDYERIVSGYISLSSAKLTFPSIFGDGCAAEAILKILLK